MNIRSFRSRVALPLVTVLALVSCNEDDGAAPEHPGSSVSPVVVTTIIPNADVTTGTEPCNGGAWDAHFTGSPDNTNLYTNLKDGSNTSYLVSDAAAAWARHGVQFMSPPSGTVSDVKVSFTAKAGTGAAGTAQVKLYDGLSTCVNASSTITLTGSYAPYSADFPGLSLPNGDNLIALILFNNTAAAGSLYWSEVSADVTTAGGFAATGLKGAGFQNVVALNPSAASNTVLSGADDAGLHRSSDLGLNFRAQNNAFRSTGDLKIASIVYHPSIAGKVYAAIGKGATGSVWRSTDDGQTWVDPCTTNCPNFQGGNAGNQASEHPRATGTLVAVDGATGTLWAATYDGWVSRSIDDGVTWTGLSGPTGTHYLRGLAYDAASDTLYVASFNDGVYKRPTAKSSGSFSLMSGSPKFPEELRLVNGVLYAAANKDGVYKMVGSTWSAINGTSPTNVTTDPSCAPATSTSGCSPSWISIDGYYTGTATVLYAGCDNAVSDGAGNYKAIMKSSNGGSSWTSVTAAANVPNDNVLGSGEAWWLVSQAPYQMLGENGSTVAQIAIDPNDHDTVFMAGRSGLFRASSATTTPIWSPAVNGMLVTIPHAIIVDPGDASKVYVAINDYTFLYSTNGMDTVIPAEPPGIPKGSDVGNDVAVDTGTTPSTVYVSTGARDTNTLGQIWSNPDVAAGGSWTDESFSVSGKRAIGIAVGRNTSNVRVIVAAVEQGGIWRKVGTGAWAQVATTPMGTAQGTRQAPIVWVPGTQTIYLFDRTSGVFRSTNAGGSWTSIWAHASDVDYTGYLAATSAGTVYVSANDGLYRITNADTAPVISTAHPSIAKPGAISLGSGTLWVARRATSTTSTDLFSSTNPGAATWSSAIFTSQSDAYYADVAGFPYDMAIGGDGHVYVSLSGNGVIKR